MEVPSQSPGEQLRQLEETFSHNASKIIVPYLTARVGEFRELSDFRQKGWENPAGDAFFQKQRREADEADDEAAKVFFKIMGRIGRELHHKTGGFRVAQQGSEQRRILDFCMAPRGYLETALRINPGSQAVAFSLPISNGGHKVLLSDRQHVDVKFLDITMLAADMGVFEIPEDRPDAGNFLPRKLQSGQLFDLVFCDGQVLRDTKHLRPSYREAREASRLITTQLSLGLEHLRPGGTMVVLLHKLEAWCSVCILHQFNKFSSIQLFKPQTSHAKRSSFYLVATEIESRHPEAISAIQNWKSVWKVATFGTAEEYENIQRRSSFTVEEVLENFGPKLVDLGRKVWATQAEALKEASFIKGR